ncbi:MAG: DUF4215 domain-containing protein, partial [bacterium]
CGAEVCDDGNTVNCDGCRGNCLAIETGCGDGFVCGLEVCDDGNTTDCDGCRGNCLATESGCGDGFTCPPETCDDGGTIPGDGCDAVCQVESSVGCGNGILEPGEGETCDDGNTNAGDGCSAACQVEPGWECFDHPSPPPANFCSPMCGNGIVEAANGETCDDGNRNNNDACPDGWLGTCQPATCGDGHVYPASAGGTEECDDGNAVDCDGCNTSCEADCSNCSTTDCNPAGETLIAGSAFVDSSPPECFVQCAGFENTSSNDVDWEWEMNCYGFVATLRVRIWDTSTGSGPSTWTLLADGTLLPDSTAGYATENFITTSHGGTMGMGSVGLLKDPPGSNPAGLWCSSYGDTDAMIGVQNNSQTIDVCSADDYNFGPPPKYACTAATELALRATSYGTCGPAPSTTDLAIAFYYERSGCTPAAPPPAPPAGFPAVLLLQALVNPGGADAGLEWLTLYNNYYYTVDLSAYSLGWGGTVYTDGTADLSGSIQPGQCFVVGGPASNANNASPAFDLVLDFSTFSTWGLENAGAATDGIALFDMAAGSITPASCPLDALLYGSPNTNSLVDEASCPAAGTPDVATTPAELAAMQRTDMSTWIITAADPSFCWGGASLPACIAADLQIVQVFYDHTDTDDGLEWVQLHNAGAGCSLDGFSLGWGGTDYTYGGVDLTGNISAGGCFIVGGPTGDAENGNPVYSQAVNLTPDLQNGGTQSDGIALFDVPMAGVIATTCPIDAVIYDLDGNVAGLLDETCVAGVPDVDVIAAAATGTGLLKNGPTSWTTTTSVDPGICPGSTLILLDESFDTCVPSGWTIDDGFLDGLTWECCPGGTCTAGSGNYTANTTGSPSGGTFIRCDSDDDGNGILMQEGLVTPSLDLSSYTTVELRFYHHYNDLGAGDSGKVQYSTSGQGGPWTTHTTYTADVTGQAVLDVSAQVAGQPNVAFRFYYDDGNTWAYYWKIDDVQVVASYW